MVQCSINGVADSINVVADSINVVADSIVVLHITINTLFERAEWSDKSGIISI